MVTDRDSVPSRMRQRATALLLGSIFVAMFVNGSRAQDAQPPAQTEKRLIEFGWDEPDTAFLRKHIAEMEQTPFDGCVFHVMATGENGKADNFTWLGWGERAFSENELKPALEDLKATTFHRFTHNFLRFNTSPGKLDWFDDHSAVINNARLAAQFAREGRCAGLLFDIEEYEGHLFTYEKLRDAATESWDEYAAQARKRGREVMEAFQVGDPDLTVFLTFGYSLPRTISDGGKTPLAKCQYGLLAPFLDGMVEATRGKARLVDGFELAYSYKKKDQFAKGYDLMKQGVLPIVADPGKYAQVFSAGFGLWLDNDWRHKGWNTDDFSKNVFTPNAFGTSVWLALERSDEFVWVYSETPRWWSNEGTTVQLPAAYETAIRQAREAVTSESTSLPRAFLDGTGPGWRTLGEDDFVNVNCDPQTWTWKGGVCACTGQPIGVCRTRKPLTNFELVGRWRHLQSGGNSGFFAWASDEAIKDLKPGTLPRGGIEIQVLDHGYTEQFEKSSGKKADWFTTNGDLFAVGTSKMTPFPPTSPDGSRSFPRKNLSKGVGEWNHYYVRCINGEVRLWVNGQEVSGGTGCEPRSGYLCLESEGAPIEFTDLRIRELP